MQCDSEVIKIAIEVDNEQFLHKFPKNYTLANIIDDVCKERGKTGKNEQWGLQFKHTVDGKYTKKYVTENNRDDIKDGCVLKLVASIQYMISWIFVNSDVTDPNKLSEKYMCMMELCNDIAFVQKMEECKEHNKIPFYAMEAKGDNIYKCLKSVSRILYFRVVPTITDDFVIFLINIVKSTDNGISLNVLIVTLELLSQIMYLVVSRREYIIKKLKIDDVMPHIWRNDNSNMQIHTLRLLNNFIKYTTDREPQIQEIKNVKNKKYVYENVIFNSNASRHSQIAHELYVLQTYMLSSYSNILKQQVYFDNEDSKPEDMESNFSVSNRSTLIDFEDKVDLIKKNRLHSQTSSETPRFSRASSVDELSVDTIVMYRSKTMSMASISEPIILSQLVVNCIDYYKANYKKNFNMSVLETRYDPGFYFICDEITHMLCEILHIGKEPDEISQLYSPLVFSAENKPFFEELFCRAVWLLARTRREMKAKYDEDHEKVLAVLKKQIELVLESRQLIYIDLTNKMKSVSHLDVFAIWEKERHEKWNKMLQSHPSVQELKSKFLPDIEKLINEQRMRVLCNGDYFPKLPEKKGRQQYWFINLTTNNRKLLYGDYDPETKKFTSEKTEIAISDIMHVVTGKASPHVKDNRVRRHELFSRCFSLLLTNEASLDFLAHDEKTAQYWIDGFHLLLGKPGDSPSYRDERQMLLNMDLNLHLLELQDISLPENPPPVPLLPPEYRIRVKPQLPPKSPSISSKTRRTIIFEKKDK